MPWTLLAMIATVVICNVVMLLSFAVATYQEFRPSKHKNAIQFVSVGAFAIAIITVRYIIWKA